MEKLTSFKKDGFDIDIFTGIDEFTDCSYIGYYTNALKPGVIVCQFGVFYEDMSDEQIKTLNTRSRKFLAFRPYMGDEKVGTDEYKKFGLEDYKRMESLSNGEWEFIFICAKVFKKEVELGSCTIFGFESNRSKEYLITEGKIIADQALEEAKENLKKLRNCEEKSI